MKRGVQKSLSLRNSDECICEPRYHCAPGMLQDINRALIATVRVRGDKWRYENGVSNRLIIGLRNHISENSCTILNASTFVLG
eukprot:m.33854 g.33854  ORF g.33854 m.33854 type:complete len:83 (-) comp6480_c0_seq1:618-866(-)